MKCDGSGEQLKIKPSEIFGIAGYCIPLAQDQVRLLMELSKAHYSSECVNAGKVGGFLYGWSNRVTFDPTAVCIASHNELDICLKILELSWMLQETDQDEAMQLSFTLRHLIKLAQTVTKTWRVEV
jgi:hypothetical protein